MAVAHATPRGYLERPRPSGLADVIDVILDKGLVIDAYVRVSLIGIEILTIDARIVIASVDTYLRFAEAVGRMDIAQDDQAAGLPDLMESITSGGAESKTKGALEGVKDKLFGDDDDDDSDDDGDDEQQSSSRRRSSSSKSSGSGSRSSGSGSRSSGSRSSGSGSRSSGSGSRSRSRSSS
jgi:gas vesicle structural protein